MREHTVDSGADVEKPTIDIEKDKTGKGDAHMLLSEALPLVHGTVRLTVQEIVKMGDRLRQWHLDMNNGPSMLDFLRNHTKLVDGPLLLNCDVAEIRPAGQIVATGNGLVTYNNLTTDVVVVMEEEE